MTVYLAHHRAFCEELGRLHALGVSWDGNGSIPLRRKPLQAAMELFGRRPDLTIGSKVALDRGGVDIALFRGARDLQIRICKAGSLLVSGHRPGSPPDFMISGSAVTEGLLEKIESMVPSSEGAPFLSRKIETDVILRIPFEGFVVLQLKKAELMSEFRLLIGREGPVPDLYAYHDVVDLPEDIYQDQPLTGQSALRTLVTAYLGERCKSCAPA